MTPNEIAIKRRVAWDKFYKGRGPLTVKEWGELASDLDGILDYVIAGKNPRDMEENENE